MKRSVKIISVMIVLMISISLVFALDTAATGYSISGGAQKSIDVHGTCRNVYMELARQVFVPTKTATEWNSFLAHPPYGAVVSACARCNDDVCNGNETCESCPTDCYAICPTCSNGQCETWFGEGCECWEDCGQTSYCQQASYGGWGSMDDGGGSGGTTSSGSSGDGSLTGTYLGDADAYDAWYSTDAFYGTGDF